MTEWCVMSLDRWAEVTAMCGFYSNHNEKPRKCVKQENDTDLFFLKISLWLPCRELTLEGKWQEWGSFPGGSEVKASACNAGDLGSIPGSGRFPWRGKWQPTPVFLPGEWKKLVSSCCHFPHRRCSGVLGMSSGDSEKSQCSGYSLKVELIWPPGGMGMKETDIKDES